MGYCTVSDIKKVIPENTLIQLTDDNDLGKIDQAFIFDAITQADSEINSYCGVKYSVPFTVAPDIIKKISIDIAIYNLYSRRVEEIPDIRGDRYRTAIRQLEGIAKGTVSIGEDPEPAAHSQGGVETNKTSDDRIFTKDKLNGF